MMLGISSVPAGLQQEDADVGVFGQSARHTEPDEPDPQTMKS